MKKILILATVGGFLPQFELDNVRILQELGYEVHYAANLEHPNYSLAKDCLEGMGIRLHQISYCEIPIPDNTEWESIHGSGGAHPQGKR